MDAFALETDQATRRLFWTVFAVLTSVTYALATVGLFGFHLVAAKRKQLTDQATARWYQAIAAVKGKQGDTTTEGNGSQA